MTDATKENDKAFADAYLDCGLKPDFWWMGVGRYPCNGDWTCTGTWRPGPVRADRPGTAIAGPSAEYCPRSLRELQHRHTIGIEAPWAEAADAGAREAVALALRRQGFGVHTARACRDWHQLC